MGFPAIFFPRVKGNLLSKDKNSSESNSSLSPTLSFILFGTSMPTTDLPGIGASILISEEARFKAKSSERFTILLTFTPPAAGCSS